LSVQTFIMTECEEGTREWDGDHDMFDDEEEKNHLFSVLDSLK